MLEASFFFKPPIQLVKESREIMMLVYFLYFVKNLEQFFVDFAE